ncbi:MAG: hypothetical protein ABSE48_16120 [Verrucomicrobiota bacterium]|jgi:hypothetical protein
MKHIGIFAALALLAVVTGCTTGNHKVTGRLRQPVAPEAVMVYSAMPPHAEVIGLVSADSFGGTTLDDANADALEKLRYEAGRLGANGLVLGKSTDQPLAGAKLQAKAIYVSP